MIGAPPTRDEGPGTERTLLCRLAELPAEKVCQHFSVAIVCGASEIINDSIRDLGGSVGRTAELTVQEGGQDFGVSVIRSATKVVDNCFSGLSRVIGLHAFTSQQSSRRRFCRFWKA